MNEHTKVLVDDVLAPLANDKKASMIQKGNFGPALCRQVEIFLQYWVNRVLISLQIFDAFPVITNCAMDIICTSAMGYNIDAQHGNSTYMWAICRYSEIIADRWVWIFKFSLWPEIIHTLTISVQTSSVEWYNFQITLQQELHGQSQMPQNYAWFDWFSY